MNSSHKPSHPLPSRLILAALAAASCATACLVPAGAAAAASTGASGAKAAPTRPGGGLRPVPARAPGIRDWAVAGGYHPARVGSAQLSGWGQHKFGFFGSALVGSTPTQPGPSAVAVDRATDTIYVANGLNINGPTSPGGDTVSVIDLSLIHI